jgi:hypothetical protein
MGASRLSVVSGLMVLIAATSVQAGPPFVTDDPEPVELHHWEVYAFSLYSHTAGADFAQVPAVEVNYGPLEDVQLHLIAPLTLSRGDGEPANYGYGDTELGLKYRFIHETDWLPQVGTFPLVEVPTGNSGRGLGNGQTQLFAPIWLQKTFGKDKEWTTFGGGGFWYNPGLGHRNFLRLGWEVQRDLNEHLTLGGEIYHETPSVQFPAATTGIGNQHTTASPPGTHGHTAFNLGGYLNFDEHHHLLLSAGRDIDGPTRFACYLGFQFTF